MKRAIKAKNKIMKVIKRVIKISIADKILRIVIVSLIKKDKLKLKKFTLNKEKKLDKLFD